MADTATFNPTDAGAARKAKAAEVTMSADGKQAPAKKQFVGMQVNQTATEGAPAHVASSGGMGRGANAGAAKELVASRLPQNKQGPKVFELPPAFSNAMERNGQFFKRVFSAEGILQPLPPALKYSLQRNFGFFTRIFTQFINPEQQKEVKQSIPGLSKSQKQ